jgi:hypothetical protein
VSAIIWGAACVASAWRPFSRRRRPTHQLASVALLLLRGLLRILRRERVQQRPGAAPELITRHSAALRLCVRRRRAALRRRKARTNGALGVGVASGAAGSACVSEANAAPP